MSSADTADDLLIHNKQSSATYSKQSSTSYTANFAPQCTTHDEQLMIFIIDQKFG